MIISVVCGFWDVADEWKEELVNSLPELMF